MKQELEAYGAGNRATEVYSPPRATLWAERVGVAPGLAFDLTRENPEDGEPWDFNDEDRGEEGGR
eukprot:8789309-Lingulodinium_polyedra.AAC.1